MQSASRPDAFAPSQFRRSDFADLYCDEERSTVELREKMPPAKRLGYATIPVSEEQALAAWPLPDVPAVVLTGGKPHGMYQRPGDDERFIEGWIRIQKEELADKMPGARHVILPDTSHMIPRANPGAIVAAVREVMERRQSGGAPKASLP